LARFIHEYVAGFQVAVKHEALMSVMHGGADGTKQLKA
jgi:hypothetical protein